MNNSNDMLDEIHRFFPAEKKDIRCISPLKLAYLGDAVFEIIIRTLTIDRMNGPVKKLHKETSSIVNAGSQASLMRAMLPYLTEEENAAYRHGRNARASSVAKHADIHDYRNATGLEALFGYLYLSGETSRAIELLKLSMDDIEKEKAEKGGSHD